MSDFGLLLSIVVIAVTLLNIFLFCKAKKLSAVKPKKLEKEYILICNNESGFHLFNRLMGINERYFDKMPDSAREEINQIKQDIYWSKKEPLFKFTEDEKREIRGILFDKYNFCDSCNCILRD